VVVFADTSRYPNIGAGALLVSVGDRRATGFEVLPKAPTARHDVVFATEAGQVASKLR
jgi:hypothetical protein